MLRCVRGSFACALLVLAGLWGTGAMAAAPAAPTHYRIVGYDTGSVGTPEIDAGKIDVIIFAFARVEHGKVVLPEKAAVRLQKLIALKKTHPALKVTISVGGWEAGGFSEAAATPAGRRLFAQTAADMVVKQHADGLDVDWEYPGSSQSGIASSPQDRVHFTQLLKLLRATLDKAGAANGHVGANHYLLTIASADSQYVHGIDLAAVAPYLDWFNVMTYDFNNSLTPLTGHHSGLFAARMAPAAARTTARAVHQYLADGVPADKIVIGAAFYGRRFDGVKPVDNGRYQPYASSTHMYGWKQLQADFINKQGYKRYWDKYADAPYLWNAATRSFISYDDPQSLAAKAAFVKANHLGGIMYWEATEDDHNQLLDAIWQGLKH
ncbi:MAG TPA: glycoside hydrolase family 18 protein [Rhodanobacteraceae bacterium]